MGLLLAAWVGLSGAGMALERSPGEVKEEEQPEFSSGTAFRFGSRFSLRLMSRKGRATAWIGFIGFASTLRQICCRLPGISRGCRIGWSTRSRTGAWRSRGRARGEVMRVTQMEPA